MVILNSKISIINQNHDGDEGKWLQAENVNLIAPHLNISNQIFLLELIILVLRPKDGESTHILDTFSDFRCLKNF